MDFRLIAECMDKLLAEDFYVPATGKHFTHSALEGQMDPDVAKALVGNLVSDTLMNLETVAKHNDIPVDDLAAYILPEVIAELGKFSAKKEIGFHAA